MGVEILPVVVALLLGGALVAGGYWAGKRARPSDSDVLDELAAVRRQQKLLQGKMNRIDPPALQAGDSGMPGPDARPLTRTELLQAMRRR